MKRTAISPISDKRKRFLKELEAIRPEILARGCEYAKNGGTATPCRGILVVHHKGGRWRKDSNAPHMLACLCDGHHRHVHAHPEWARRSGYLV